MHCGCFATGLRLLPSSRLRSHEEMVARSKLTGWRPYVDDTKGSPTHAAAACQQQAAVAYTGGAECSWVTPRWP